MGTAFPLADLSISGQLREVAKPEEFRLVLNLTDYRANQALAQVPEFRDPETETGNSKIDT